jgi:hypothetical protein
MTDDRFLKLSDGFEAEQRELITLKDNLEKEVDAEVQKSGDVDRFLALAEKYAGLTELSSTLVNELIQKIVVHKPEKLAFSVFRPYRSLSLWLPLSWY